MNILLAGGSCSLMDSMILKLRKEGHRVFLLTGDKYRHNKYQKVFVLKELIIEGVMAIQAGESPALIERKLNSFVLDSHLKESNEAKV